MIRMLSGSGRRKPEDEDVPDLRTDHAHGARIYDYILGGKDNFAADRAVGDASMAAWPALRTHMVANRTFMHRVGRFLAAERGISQFLDIGTGIPTEPNLHQIVQEVRPGSQIVYTDNDPIVLAHARALMSGTDEGRIAYIHADMRDAESLMESPQLREVLDLGRPVGLLIIAVVHFIEDDDEAYHVVRQVVDALPSGSYLAASVATDDFDPVPLAEVQRQYRAAGEVLRFRPREKALRFFDGLEMEEPGLVQLHKWRPEPGTGPIADTDVAMYGAVARKP
jgi:S-adenosyl methyltransferase